MKRFWLIVPVFFVALLLTAYAVRDSHPALLRLSHHRNAVSGEYNFVVLNPFRDRGPERKAAEYLQALRQGDCGRVAATSVEFRLPNDQSCEQFIGEHRGYVDGYSFPLRDVTRSHDDVLLYYSKTGYEFTAVRVTKSASEWKVNGFEMFW